MDWLKGMNRVVEHIEEHLALPLPYESLSRIVGCSVYEFSRIFSFMAGMSVSEYIRRRRLSQAVFDIQSGDTKIIDIALKYGYESPTTFTRAFKELHGTTPSSARETGVPLKTFPPISFILSIRGVDGMNFRIEKKNGFMLMGIPSFLEVGDDAMPASMYTAKVDKSATESFYQNLGNPFIKQVGPDDFEGTELKVGPEGDTKIKVAFRGEDGSEASQIITAFDYELKDGKTMALTGQMIDAAEIEKLPQEEEAQFAMFEQLGMAKVIPASSWAVFAFDSQMDNATVSGAYARILTEWFPTSRYKRNEVLPHMEIIHIGEDSGKRGWEIWMPVDIS